MEKKICSRLSILYLFFHLFSLMTSTTTKMAGAQTIPIRVGVVLDMDDYGRMTFSCISMALADFYATHNHYKTRLVLINRDGKEDAIGAAAAALDLLKNVEVQAIIGPTFSVQASFVISLGNKAQVPIITFSATSPSLKSIRSPYFFRATVDDSLQVDAIAAIIKAFGWQEVVPIYQDDEFGEGIIPFLSVALEKVNARVPYTSIISPLATDDQITKELYKLMTKQTRVFIVHLINPLASRLFTKAKEIGMMSKDYAWITTDGITNELNSMDPSVIESMLGVIGLKPYIPKTKELDDFSTRFKKRIMANNIKAVDLDIFGFWAYDSAVALAVAAEKAVVTNPNYLQANTSINSTDLEAIGVSTTGPKLVEALSSTTFKGLSGDLVLVDGQLHAPPFQIVNMVGPGAQGIGYWTKEKGIVKELNSTSENKLGSIIWPGNAPSPPKGWVIPTNGKKLRVGVPVKVGFTEFVRVTWNSDNSTKVEGFCIDVFQAVIAALPYGVPYEFIPFAKADRDMAGSYNDLAYQVKLANFDAVAGDVTIVANRSEHVDFTLPYTESGVSMIVPIKDEKIKNSAIFIKPLTWELWVTILASFVFVGLCIWILERPINEDFRGSSQHQIVRIFGFAFSTMVFGDRDRVANNLSRFVLIAWFLVVLLLTQGYTANLASMLTVQKLQPTVRDVNVLIKNKEYVGYMKGSFVFGFLKKMNFSESRLIEYNSPEQLDELLSKGSGKGGISAAFHEIPYIKLFLGKYCSKYMMVEPIYKADGFGFVFPKGSPLVSAVSRAILNVTEGQQMVEIEKKWLGEKTKCPDSDTLQTPQSLGLASFWELFAFVGLVAVVAFAFYVFTFLRKHKDLISDAEFTVWKKMKMLLKKFREEELNSNRDKDGCCAARARKAMLFGYVVGISFGSVLNRLRTENAARNEEEGEVARNEEIELEETAGANENHRRRENWQMVFTEIGRLLFTSNRG